ncbi:MAG: nucleotidyltransferase domain-containing protein [Candidatus Moraniibacteriota bacterium]
MEIAELNENQMEKLRDIGVDVVYLFGSQIDGTAGELSDVDFAVVLRNSDILKQDFLSVYGSIFTILSELLPKEYLKRRMDLGAHEFDLVFLQQANPRMKFRVVENGRVLYQSSPRVVADFREQALVRYFDFQYFEKISNDAFLMRV